MAKIPFYEDRLTPQGGLNVQDRAVEVSGAVGAAMQNLGNAGANAAGVLAKMDDDNAIANASKPLSEMPGWASNRLTELATNARDGGYVDMPDGKTMTLTEAMRKEWDDASSKMLAGIENPKAKLYAQKQLDSTWGTLFTHTVTTEHGLFKQNKVDAANVSVANFAKTAAGDHTLAPKLLEDAYDTIDRIGLSEHERNVNKLTAKKTIVEAAATGLIQRNAPEVAQAIKDKYGVINTEVANPLMAKLPPENADAITQTAQRLGISAANLTAIISYETGGTFNPAERGGKNNKHIGLIQFGEAEQKAFGANQQQSFGEQMVAVEKYLKARGVQPGDDLKTLYKIINGGNRNVSDNASDDGGKTTIAMHAERIAKEHGGSAANRVPVSPEVASLVGELQADRLHTFLTEANTQISKQQTIYRSQLVSAESSHMTAFENGQPVQQPLTQQDYIKSYGEIEGPQRFANYQQAAQMGADIGSMKMMPLTEQQAVVDRYTPDPNKPGYDLAVNRQKTLQNAQTKLNTDRAADPVKWAQSNGLTDQTPINWNEISQNPQKIAQTLASRVGLATSMRDKFGAQPLLLSKSEAANLAAGFDQMDAKEKMSYLGLIATSVQSAEAKSSIFQQIAQDSPVTAYAGNLIANGKKLEVKGGWFTSDKTYDPEVVAKKVLRGEELLNPSKGDKKANGKPAIDLLPKEDELRPAFADVAKQVFQGNAELGDMVFQAAKAYYAAESEAAGDYDKVFRSKRWDTAIDKVIGGISDVNGSKTRRPWGMEETAFKDQLFSSFVKAIPHYGLSEKTTDFRNFHFVAQPNGTYIPYNGTTALNYAPDSPVVISLDGRLPEIAKPTVAPTATPNAVPSTQKQKTK